MVRSRPLAAQEVFLDRWMNSPGAVKRFHPFGAVEVENVGDPHQTLTQDGRWTFDPTNRVCQKCFWLLWPNLVGTRERVILGNIIESVLGVREWALEQEDYVFLLEHQAMTSLARRLGEFVNLAHQFIHYTGTWADLVSEWVAFVRRLQAPVVAEARLNEMD